MNSQNHLPSGSASPGQFQATRWSVVVAARHRESPEGEAALVWLCERYWRPLKAWAQAKGLPPADAEDLVQGFFEKALQGGLIGGADAARGRFRTFLLGCLTHYWMDQQRRAKAAKRGGGETVLTLSGESSEEPWVSEIPCGRTPEQEFDKAWACSVLDGVTMRLENECDADGHAGRFAVLRVFLDGDRGEMPLIAVAEKLGLSVPAAKSMVHRLRQRMREMVREEIRETVETDAQVDSELQELFRALRG